jgi:hypothetical protein
VIAAPAPIPNGRRQVQSAQLQLSAKGDRINAVSQELFTVVSAENGIVKSSQVTSQTSPGGYATFSLSIPTSKLQVTMTRLSALPFAHVVSRTDGTLDVTSQYANDQRRLADAQALRTSLLKQLATAFTTTQIDSIKAQIKDAERTINSDSGAIKRLQNQISYSSVYVQINSSPIVVVPSASKSSGGLSLGQAAHDAGRVLVVAAGVVLVGLAALVPIALLGALIAWIAYWVRRRRREHALDTA